MFGMNPRDMRRLMKQFGIKMEELRPVKVTIELDDGRLMIIEEPAGGFIIRQKGQPPMIYVIGEPRIEEKPAEESLEISEEDVKLVAEQTGVSLEEARRALEEARGDIAEAILKLQERG